MYEVAEVVTLIVPTVLPDLAKDATMLLSFLFKKRAVASDEKKACPLALIIPPTVVLSTPGLVVLV